MSLISVITCSHNPRPDFLRRALDALQSQSLGRDIWEFLLIDNASREPLATSVDLSWHPKARHIREDTVGLTPARLRGIQEACGEIVVFVDDDNVLDASYLQQVLAISEKWPQLGSWSGQNLPEFEENPPEWTRCYWGSLAIRFLERDAWSNLPHLAETMPCGAGLCVRREVATHYKYLHESGQRKVTLDRSGSSLMSAGDNDLAACACDIGLGEGVFKDLKLTHLMTKARLEEQYLLRLAESVAYSGVIFRSFRAPVCAPELPLKTRLAYIFRLMMMAPRQRRFYRVCLRGESRARRHLSRMDTRD